MSTPPPRLIARIPPRIRRPRPSRAGMSVARRIHTRSPVRIPGRSRRGATLVETAIIFSVFLLLVVGGMDLGLATFKYNTLSQAARQGVRQAVVHGALAAPASTTWGPATYTGTAGDGSPYALAVSPMLVGFTLSAVTIKVEWIDGGNAIQQRVRYTVTTSYKPVVASFFNSGTYTLSAASTMPIAH